MAPNPYPAATTPVAKPRACGNQRTIKPTIANVDDSRAYAAKQPIGRIEAPEAVDPGRQDPAEAGESGAGRDERARSEALDQPALRRREKGLQHDEQGKGELDRGEARARRRLEGLEKKRPDVLRARDGHHSDKAKPKLNPTRRAPTLPSAGSFLQPSLSPQRNREAAPSSIRQPANYVPKSKEKCRRRESRAANEFRKTFRKLLSRRIDHKRAKIEELGG